jgi:anaerobic magnesium-protoporphyrin IX monomethyl ester cyclase
MKVLFTHSYFLNRDEKQLKTGSPYPPLAPLYAAALLRENGHEVRLADLQFSGPEDIEKHIKSFSPDVLVIYDDSFNYLTKMCLTNMRDASFEMQKIAKTYNMPVIVSSSDGTDHLKKYFDQGTDYILIGEAEETLLELLGAMNVSGRDSMHAISGLAFLENGDMVKTLPRKVIKDLDRLPHPAWDLIDISQYKKTWIKHHGYFSINFVTTRGCPYKCNWCAKPVYGNRYNSHSAQRIVRELKQLQALFSFSHVWFADDIFGLKPGWLQEFSRQMKAHGVKVRYKIQSRADLLSDEETVIALKESGCDEVWLGTESGSQKVLDAMDKGTTVEQIVQATALLKKHGIKPCFFLQFGYPGESIEDINKTVSMTMRLQPHDIGISVSYPLPGTKFYESVKVQLSEKQNWTDSDDLQVMFRSTYDARFYRHLQKFVHYKFRSGQILTLLRNHKFRKKTVLLPYYYLKQRALRKKMSILEPSAAAFLS